MLTQGTPVIVALSGGVDSAVAALLLRDAGYAVQCLHMTNWEDDGYCDSAQEFQDARNICEALELPLHRVNFTREYREQVFRHFLDELGRGRTPNPDVLCNREIKFGTLKRYARRLGAEWLATGHYARLETKDGRTCLLKGRDPRKDQSYFLHGVSEKQFSNVVFPLGGYEKAEVRELAKTAGIRVADKKDSTGICFIGERPFAEFLRQYLPAEPGDIRTAEGELVGRHVGLAYYTLGQRQGLGIGGLKNHAHSPWYVAAKNEQRNELIVVQSNDHPRLFSRWLEASGVHWIGDPPAGIRCGGELRCAAKTRYRQPDQPCRARMVDSDRIEVVFDAPQRSVTPGQYVVLYLGDSCLGGGTIDRTAASRPIDALTA